jgi:hypothetical protein
MFVGKVEKVEVKGDEFPKRNQVFAEGAEAEA